MRCQVVCWAMVELESLVLFRDSNGIGMRNEANWVSRKSWWLNEISTSQLCSPTSCSQENGRITRDIRERLSVLS